jgi:hypothetical protein
METGAAGLLAENEECDSNVICQAGQGQAGQCRGMELGTTDESATAATTDGMSCSTTAEVLQCCWGDCCHEGARNGLQSCSSWWFTSRGEEPPAGRMGPPLTFLQVRPAVLCLRLRGATTCSFLTVISGAWFSSRYAPNSQPKASHSRHGDISSEAAMMEQP